MPDTGPGRANPRTVLITGATGQLGIALKRITWPEGWDVVGIGRSDLDLSDSRAVASRLMAGHAGRPFAAVINSAAYTAVDKAENDIVTAWTVNALIPAVIAQACAAADIPLIHISTDYVFAGDKDGPWEVDDPVAPLGVYGASKLGGELAVRTSGARHAIVRTAWLVSAHGHNFVKTMLRVAAERDVVRVVEDQRGIPTAAGDLAAALVSIAVRLADDPNATGGTYHFSNTEPTNWADFAREIFAQSQMRGGPVASVEGIATSDYPTPARRPANSMLSSSAIRTAFGIESRPWQIALGDILDELIGTKK